MKTVLLLFLYKIRYQIFPTLCVPCLDSNWTLNLFFVCRLRVDLVGLGRLSVYTQSHLVLLCDSKHHQGMCRIKHRCRLTMSRYKYLDIVGRGLSRYLYTDCHSVVHITHCRFTIFHYKYLKLEIQLSYCWLSIA